MIQDIGPHKLNNHYQPDCSPVPDDYVFLFKGRDLALDDHREVLSLPKVSAFPDSAEYCYLFSIDDKPCYLLIPASGPHHESVEKSADGTTGTTETALARTDMAGTGMAGTDRTALKTKDEQPGPLSPDALLPAGCAWFPARDLRRNKRSGKTLSFAAFTALQLASWYRDNTYCGTCGTHTILGKTERSIICPSCGRTIYPRIIPAVIVGVTNGDYLLHTKYERSRGISFYALVAGFTEIGETFEECVAREVMEETGLKVKNIRYYKSQPWGIVDDILAGFYCDVDGSSEIHIDRTELCEGVWVHRKDIVGQPDDASLTHHMMITFSDGKEPR